MNYFFLTAYSSATFGSSTIADKVNTIKASLIVLTLLFLFAYVLIKVIIGQLYILKNKSQAIYLK
jgi:hypothetical protein